MSEAAIFFYDFNTRFACLKFTMLKDHNHDLIHSLSEKNDAIWRYEREYLKNAEGCEHCQNMWRKLAEDDNKHVEMLRNEIKRHINEERFD